jgi:mono/diheme cytochrome c family protein
LSFQSWYWLFLQRRRPSAGLTRISVCHGSNAEGTRDWKKTDANGNYPPPPLDGSAHAWHHPLAQLARSIKEGGIKLGGVMPPFGDKLSDQEVLAVIAYFQSKWPDEAPSLI